ASTGFGGAALFGSGFTVFLLLVGNDFLAAFLVDNLHGQANLATLVKAHQLDPDLVTFLDDVGGLGNTLGSELRDVDEAVTGAEEIDESAEVGGLDNRAFVDGADFRFRNDGVDPLAGRFDFLA